MKALINLTVKDACHRQTSQNGTLDKRIRTVLILSMFIGYTATATAQETEQTIELKEVEVKAARVVHKTDGLLLYPTDEQKTSSASGYSVLQQLTLPNIRIDEVSHSVTAIDNKGSVQLRINGIIVDQAEMLALDPKTISKIDFIDQPGVRYGDEIAYVINITTRRNESGYTVGTDMTQSLTARNGNYSVYGKWNTGKSEFSLNYGFGYQDYNGNRMEETAWYHLNDGSVYTIRRNDTESRSRYFNNNIKLTYNLADSTDYVFQASLTGNFNHIPGNFNRKEIQDGTNDYLATQTNNSLSQNPVLDLYYFRQLTPNQSLTFNAVGTYIDTRSSSSYNEGSPYVYNVEGKTYSFLSEAIYENRLKPFTLSAGVNYSQKYTDNEYTGDVSSLNLMHNSRIYAFSEIKGTWGKFRYTAGVGVSYLYYRQDEHSYNHWTFCPKASLSYNFTDRLQLSYNVQSNERVSRIAMISDASIRTNSMEWTVGSPELKPNRDTYQTLRLSYADSRLQADLQGYYKICRHPNMAVYERTANDKFIYTQRNQKEIDALQVSGYVNYWLLPEKLSVAGYGGLFRCFNFGTDYTHCYTSYFVTGSLNAYLGNFSIQAYADNGWRFLEGETKGYNGSDVALKTSYRYKDWQFALIWQQPLMKRYKMFETEILNRNLQKQIALYSTDRCNLVSLNISWRLNKGRKYRTINKTIQLKDSDTGIIR